MNQVRQWKNYNHTKAWTVSKSKAKSGYASSSLYVTITKRIFERECEGSLFDVGRSVCGLHWLLTSHPHCVITRNDEVIVNCNINMLQATENVVFMLLDLLNHKIKSNYFIQEMLRLISPDDHCQFKMGLIAGSYTHASYTIPYHSAKMRQFFEI